MNAWILGISMSNRARNRDILLVFIHYSDDIRAANNGKQIHIIDYHFAKQIKNRIKNIFYKYEQNITICSAGMEANDEARLREDILLI